MAPRVACSRIEIIDNTQRIEPEDGEFGDSVASGDSGGFGGGDCNVGHRREFYFCLSSVMFIMLPAP